jgi:hypothetical protein
VSGVLDTPLTLMKSRHAQEVFDGPRWISRFTRRTLLTTWPSNMPRPLQTVQLLLLLLLLLQRHLLLLYQRWAAGPLRPCLLHQRGAIDP